MAQRIKNVLLGLIPFASIGFLWWFFYRFGMVPKWMIPSPLDTLQTFWALTIDGTLVSLVWMSLQNVLFGFLLAIIFSLILGTLIGLNSTARKVFLPFLSAIYPIPSLAWLPLLILILGFTKETILCVIFISSSKKMIYNVIDGVRNVNSNWILAGKNLGLNRLEIVFKIILPASLPHIMTGVRMGFGSAWRSLIGAEMLVVGIGGLGKFIWMSQWFFDFSKVFSGIIVIALIGLCVEQLIFKRLENKTLVKWGFIQGDT